MKSFSTPLVMALTMTTTLVEAQAILQPNGTFTCGMSNGTYCVSDSLQSPLIVRCINGAGHVGNCNDNVAGEYPTAGFASCWASSPISGIAACSKNCIVYGGSGDSGTFSLPGCVPSVASSLAPATASAGVAVNSYNGSAAVKTSVGPGPATVTDGAGMVNSGNGSMTLKNTSPMLPAHVSTPLMPFPTNATAAARSSSSRARATSAAHEQSESATATPKSPPSTTVSAVPTFTGAAGTMKAGSAIAAVGFFFVAFL